VARSGKNNQKKRNANAKNSSLYDLDNFVINSNSTKSFVKTNEKQIKIFTPNFKFLDLKFYSCPNFVISKDKNEPRETGADEEVNTISNY
jgi:hypothetical protein